MQESISGHLGLGYGVQLKANQAILLDLLRVFTRLQPMSVSYHYPEDGSIQEPNLLDGILSTEDGWPSESFIEFSQSKRLLLGYGTVDPQMQNYNFSADESIIFPASYIQADQDVVTTSTGRLTQGCFVHHTTDVKSSNSSWATASNLAGFSYPTSPTSNVVPLLNLTSNTTNCGISPILNVTLLNTTAQENYIPYQNYSYSTIW